MNGVALIGVVFVVWLGAGFLVARLFRNPRDEDECARLIAAAPDLLEALREMVACDAEAIEDAERIGIPFPDEMLATYNKACAAIAKATGERP